MSQELRRVPFTVARCPECDRAHTFTLIVDVELPRRPAMLVGGEQGRAELPGRADNWNVRLWCPRKRRSFEERVPISLAAGEKLLQVSVAESGAAEGQSAGAVGITEPTWQEQAFRDWVHDSATVPREFAGKMLSTAVGGVAVYFAVLKFIGFEHPGTGWGAVSIAPPLLFLSAAVTFALALKPSASTVASEDDFIAFRERRLTVMNRRNLIGMALFSVAVAIGIGVCLVRLLR